MSQSSWRVGAAGDRNRLLCRGGSKSTGRCKPGNNGGQRGKSPRGTTHNPKEGRLTTNLGPRFLMPTSVRPCSSCSSRWALPRLPVIQQLVPHHRSGLGSCPRRIYKGRKLSPPRLFSLLGVVLRPCLFLPFPSSLFVPQEVVVWTKPQKLPSRLLSLESQCPFFPQRNLPKPAPPRSSP